MVNDLSAVLAEEETSESLMKLAQLLVLSELNLMIKKIYIYIYLKKKKDFLSINKLSNVLYSN